MPPKTKEQVLDESTRVAQDAAKMIGGSFERGVGFKKDAPPTLANAGTASNILQSSPSSTPGFSINIPDTIPSNAISEGGTTTDAQLRRDQMEADNKLFTDLQGRASATATPFSNPEQFLNNLLLNEPTQTSQDLTVKAGEQASNLRGYASEIEKTRAEQNIALGVPELNEALAETRMQKANRIQALRQQMRDFETNAKLRGVDREFVEGAKAKAQADATAEIADLSIVEAAQLGNLEQSQKLIDQIISDKKFAFEAENKAIETEIANLERLNTEQSKQRAEKLSIALDERKRNIETALKNESEIRSYMADAAANGADQGTIDAIRNAKTPGEALMMASPFIGRLERQAKLANIAQSWASVAASNTNRLLALAEAGDEEAIKKLKFDPRTIKEEIDPVIRRQLEGAVDSGTNLLRLAEKYKQIIDNHGYTNRVFGDTEVLGQISSLRALMTAEYKKAETLGTLDAGVLSLMSQIVGEEPTSGFFTPLANVTGRKSDKLSAQIGTFIENITLAQARDKARLGIEPTVDFSVIAEDDDLEINAIMGVETSTPQQGGFNPNTFYKK